MSKSSINYLRDFLRELDDIAAFTLEGRQAFMTDLKTQKAVIRSYEVIGEICKRLPAELRAANDQIDWRLLITFRDFLAHNYEFIVLHRIWEAVEDVPSLRIAVEAMLLDLPDDEENERGD
jgi:uncharacterized protein with HEPN domain